MPSPAAIRRDQERRYAVGQAEPATSEQTRAALNRNGDYLVGAVTDSHGHQLEVHVNSRTGIVTVRTGPAHVHVRIQLPRERTAELANLLKRASS